MLCGYERRKLEGLKPNYNLIWLLLEKTKRGFCECISNKRRAKEKLHPLLDAGENTVTKAEEKAEVLSIKYLFASVFISEDQLYARYPSIPWIERQKWREEWTPHNPRRKSQQPATPATEVLACFWQHLAVSWLLSK